MELSLLLGSDNVNLSDDVTTSLDEYVQNNGEKAVTPAVVVGDDSVSEEYTSPEDEAYNKELENELEDAAGDDSKEVEGLGDTIKVITKTQPDTKDNGSEEEPVQIPTEETEASSQEDEGTETEAEEDFSTEEDWKIYLNAVEEDTITITSEDEEVVLECESTINTLTSEETAVETAVSGEDIATIGNDSSTEDENQEIVANSRYETATNTTLDVEFENVDVVESIDGYEFTYQNGVFSLTTGEETGCAYFQLFNSATGESMEICVAING